MENTEQNISISKIKKEMKSYIDFLGGSIEKSKIESAVTKKDLYDLIEEHEDFIIDIHTDALGHLRRFSERIGLNIEPED